MNHYAYQQRLKEVWKTAVGLYAKGNRNSQTYFKARDLVFLDSIGATAQEVYDFAEDYNGANEPDFATFALIQDIRRWYFLEVQGGQRSNKTSDPATYPAKSDSARGIEWLPRIIPKARAKLRGELDSDTMYCCGGDRRFMKNNDIHPAEFLRVVAAHKDDDEAIMDWVESRAAIRQASPVT